MTTYISILRGINVSGHNIIKMDALKKSYSALGFKNIITYIQSGNVVFQFKKSGHLEIEKMIKNKIADDFGYDVPVIVIDFQKLKNVVQKNPFLCNNNVDLSMLHVTFLSAVPEKSDVNKINEVDYSPDKFIVVDDIVYLYFPDGYGNTKLNNNFFENKLKVIATNRNWKTVNKLFDMVNEVIL